MPDSECKKCHGTGFVVKTDKDGNEYAEKCSCTKKFNIKKKFKLSNIPERFKNCNFKNYKPKSESQKKALAISKKFVESFPMVQGGLFFQGPTGVGKTHLSVAILKHLIKNREEFTYLFYEVNELIGDVQATIGSSSDDQNRILQRVFNVNILVLDDLGSHRITDWSDDVIYRIISKRYSNSSREGLGKKITIFTSNYLDKKGIYEESEEKDEDSLEDRIGCRLRSRIYEMAKTVEIDADDYRKETLEKSIQI